MMSERMRILIGYDGSECADAALEDLRRAGLPRAAEAVVLSVADVFVPAQVNEEIDDTFPLYIPAGVRAAHEYAARLLSEASMTANRAARSVRESFPGWEVRVEASAESPAWALIREADEWPTDLVVVVAHGHASLGGRLVLGSVSQRVLDEARSSVRVARSGARKGATDVVRILLGVDGSRGAEAAVVVASGERALPPRRGLGRLRRRVRPRAAGRGRGRTAQLVGSRNRRGPERRRRGHPPPGERAGGRRGGRAAGG